MAKPRIFISSTYYDLKHIRDSLAVFVDRLGFEPILSEKGNIADLADRPLMNRVIRRSASPTFSSRSWAVDTGVWPAMRAQHRDRSLRLDESAQPSVNSDFG